MSRRRYKIGKFPRYDAEYDHLKGKSPVLNRRLISNISLNFWSERGLKDMVLEWEGEKDGCYASLKDRQWTMSRLKHAQEGVASVDRRFEGMVVRAKRSGRYPPTEMPDELIQEKLAAEAILDIVTEELELIKKLLADTKVPEKKREDELVLAYGPQGSTQGADPPRTADGQPVRWDEKQGHFIIDCKKSPYDGVRLPDYFAFVCKPWRDAKSAAYLEAHEKAVNLDLGEGERLRAAEEAARILRDPKFPPWPPRPEGL